MIGTRAREDQSTQPRPYSEERIVRRGGLDLRLMINRSHAHMRFMDYRVGNYDHKCKLIDEVARREGLRKVFTLVEKSDSGPWRSAGFVREGVYPSFFRTADAYVMSRLYGSSGKPLAPAPALKASANEATRFPARKLREPAGFALKPVEEEGSRREVLNRLNGALGALPFGRIKAPDVVVHARDRRREGWVCAELDDSFGHATMSFAPCPTNDSELVLYAYASNAMLARLKEAAMENIFGVSPVEDRWSSELFVGLGFRVTGRLSAHLRPDGAGNSNVNALLWHRRIGD